MRHAFQNCNQKLYTKRFYNLEAVTKMGLTQKLNVGKVDKVSILKFFKERLKNCAQPLDSNGFS